MPSLWSLLASIVSVQGFEELCLSSHLRWTGLLKTQPPMSRELGERCFFDRTSRRTDGPKAATYAGGCKMDEESADYIRRHAEPGWRMSCANLIEDVLGSSAPPNGLPTRWRVTRPTSSPTFVTQLDDILAGQSV